MFLELPHAPTSRFACTLLPGWHTLSTEPGSSAAPQGSLLALQWHCQLCPTHNAQRITLPLFSQHDHHVSYMILFLLTVLVNSGLQSHVCFVCCCEVRPGIWNWPGNSGVWQTLCPLVTHLCILSLPHCSHPPTARESLALTPEGFFITVFPRPLKPLEEGTVQLSIAWCPAQLRHYTYTGQEARSHWPPGHMAVLLDQGPQRECQGFKAQKRP